MSTHPLNAGNFRLILASTSRYRAQLLQTLGLPFEQIAPDCDETPENGELPQALVKRLSRLKALSVVKMVGAETRYPVVIGSDQVADCNGQILGKPHTPERAVQQLQQMRGQSVVFRTGLCVATTNSAEMSEDVINITARFRDLSDAEIERYVEKEQPLDCAGSFRSEALGISLLDALQAEDPNALIGLPLIKLSACLRQLGFQVP